MDCQHPAPPFPLNLANIGPTPGVLDPTQERRILREPNSTLHFIPFDPLTAGGGDAGLKRQDPQSNPEGQSSKRIVVEVLGGGRTSWRFVPSARREPGVNTEGVWPRVIDICGILVYCSQDQWDIYKLDPHYDCFVRQYPNITTIRRAPAAAFEAAHLGKREREANEAEYPYESRTSDSSPRHKRVYTEPSEKNSASPSPFSLPTSQRDLRAKRKEREEEKQKRFMEGQQDRIRAREERMWQDAMNDVPQQGPSSESYTSFASQPSAPTDDRDDACMDVEGEDLSEQSTRNNLSPEEAARIASVQESRRRMQELEADRPLWEQTARERKRQEAQEASCRAKREDRTGQVNNTQAYSRDEAGDEGARSRAQEREARQAREREARRRPWMTGEWTLGRAVDRFIHVCEYFDKTRFSETCPLFVDDVPWPIVRHPDSLNSPNDISWAAVEEFCGVLKSVVSVEEYAKLVGEAHRRFHPDRWRSRGLFKAILDVEEREFMELAATTVSQAMTPIWRNLKDSRQ